MTTYRLLVIGDSHIPRRAKDVPQKVLKNLTGDLINYDNFIEFLVSRTATKLFRVMGNMDYYAGRRDSPIYEELSIELPDDPKKFLRIGLTHGAQIERRGDHTQLEEIANEKNYNILISGHTHKEEIFKTSKGVLLLNPGSVTGAWSFIASRNCCFIVIQIEADIRNITIDLYCLDKQTRVIKKSSKFYKFDGNKVNNKFKT
ncbi:MAG: YfcE family phosphodiesterase [Candidatus Lokiarchaeota archaeon]